MDKLSNQVFEHIVKNAETLQSQPVTTTEPSGTNLGLVVALPVVLCIIVIAVCVVAGLAAWRWRQLQKKYKVVSKKLEETSSVRNGSIRLTNGRPDIVVQTPRMDAGELYVVRHCYVTDDVTQLNLQTGQIVEVLEKSDSGWWSGRLDGRIGWFPASSVKKMEAHDNEGLNLEDEEGVTGIATNGEAPLKPAEVSVLDEIWQVNQDTVDGYSKVQKIRKPTSDTTSYPDYEEPVTHSSSDTEDSSEQDSSQQSPDIPLRLSRNFVEELGEGRIRLKKLDQHNAVKDLRWKSAESPADEVVREEVPVMSALRNPVPNATDLHRNSEHIYSEAESVYSTVSEPEPENACGNGDVSATSNEVTGEDYHNYDVRRASDPLHTAPNLLYERRASFNGTTHDMNDANDVRLTDPSHGMKSKLHSHDVTMRTKVKHMSRDVTNFFDSALTALKSHTSRGKIALMQKLSKSNSINFRSKDGSSDVDIYSDISLPETPGEGKRPDSSGPPQLPATFPNDEDEFGDDIYANVQEELYANVEKPPEAPESEPSEEKHFVAMYPFTPTVSGQLALARNDVIIFLKETQDWMRGRSKETGEQGWFPSNYVRECMVSDGKLLFHHDSEQQDYNMDSEDDFDDDITGEEYVAVFPYVAQHEDDLNLDIGNLVVVVEMLENGWWRGYHGDDEGWFPSSYVEVTTQVPPAPSSPDSGFTSFNQGGVSLTASPALRDDAGSDNSSEGSTGEHKHRTPKQLLNAFQEKLSNINLPSKWKPELHRRHMLPKRVTVPRGSKKKRVVGERAQRPTRPPPPRPPPPSLHGRTMDGNPPAFKVKDSKEKGPLPPPPPPPPPPSNVQNPVNKTDSLSRKNVLRPTAPPPQPPTESSSVCSADIEDPERLRIMADRDVTESSGGIDQGTKINSNFLSEVSAAIATRGNKPRPQRDDEGDSLSDRNLNRPANIAQTRPKPNYADDSHEEQSGLNAGNREPKTHGEASTPHKYPPLPVHAAMPSSGIRRAAFRAKSGGRLTASAETPSVNTPSVQLHQDTESTSNIADTVSDISTANVDDGASHFERRHSSDQSSDSSERFKSNFQMFEKKDGGKVVGKKSPPPILMPKPRRGEVTRTTSTPDLVRQTTLSLAAADTSLNMSTPAQQARDSPVPGKPSQPPPQPPPKKPKVPSKQPKPSKPSLMGRSKSVEMLQAIFQSDHEAGTTSAAASAQSAAVAHGDLRNQTRPAIPPKRVHQQVSNSPVSSKSPTDSESNTEKSRGTIQERVNVLEGAESKTESSVDLARRKFSPSGVKPPLPVRTVFRKPSLSRAASEDPSVSRLRTTDTKDHSLSDSQGFNSAAGGRRKKPNTPPPLPPAKPAKPSMPYEDDIYGKLWLQSSSPETESANNPFDYSHANTSLTSTSSSVDSGPAGLGPESSRQEQPQSRVPKRVPRPRRARLNYVAVNVGELNFKSGDIITEIGESDKEGWMLGQTSDGTKGIYPISHVQEL